MAADAFREGFGIPERKADGSVVSEADRAVESFVRERIAAECPHNGILADLITSETAAPVADAATA